MKTDMPMRTQLLTTSTIGITIETMHGAKPKHRQMLYVRSRFYAEWRLTYER
jgi:hypothetical protein